MAGHLGRMNPQYYQSSGEATEQAQLPEEFVATMPATSPLSGHLTIGTMESWDIRRAPVVSRVERTVGMRHDYVRGATRMPVRRLGADGIPVPWNSAAQPDDMGPIRNNHFNDALFQAGYPGFNLGLSFKVPNLPSQSAAATRPQVQAPRMISVSPKLFNRLRGGENQGG
jgi:hypothetical protein